MNDDDLALAPDRQGRVAELLRRAGVVEEGPPASVRESLVRSLREDDSHPGPAAPVELVEARRRREARGSGAGRPRHGSGGVRLLAAAAAGAVLTLAGLSLAERVPAQVVASGELAALSESGVEGRAEVVEVDGHQRLRVELEAAPDAGDGYLEVWLLRPDVSGMVTLGVLDGQTAEFPLPEGLDLSEFAVVDISREHVDGDPGHGGDSLVRGEVG